MKIYLRKYKENALYKSYIQNEYTSIQQNTTTLKIRIMNLQETFLYACNGIH